MNRVDFLINIENNIQKKWENCNIFNATCNDNNKKIFVTFPFPYMNGTLHLGHAFTITKADFINRFYNLKSYNTLFPFAFHATGTPIVSSSNKLENILSNINLNEININELSSDNQIKILYNMNVPLELIPNFVKPEYWVEYFPQIAEIDLKKFGSSIDFSRKFITTNINYYYDTFIKWQFNKLKKHNLLIFGKNYLIYSPLKKQPCGDHDRQIGEGVKPKKYKIITIKTNIYDYIHKIPEDVSIDDFDKTPFVIKNTLHHIIIKYENTCYICTLTMYKNLKYQNHNVCIIGDITKSELDNTIFTKTFFTKLNIEYYEPETRVVSRFGDECVVALTDQWYIDYGNKQIKDIVDNHINNNFETFDNNVKELLLAGSKWIDKWPCSRLFGLGTKLLNTEYVIDSLSDSTIYMAYYTISHLIDKIPKNIVDDDFWDYIFTNSELPTNITDNNIIHIMNDMKKEFNYWYPVDIRVSGKDLIQNHLIMCLYNHAMIFPNHMPKSYYINGHMLLNGKKMSKSNGIFLTLNESVKKYGADVTRFVLANSSSTTVSDGNFVENLCESVINKLYIEFEWITNMTNTLNNNNINLSIWDKLFNNEINGYMNDCEQYYLHMDYHNVIVCFNNMISSRDKYRVKYENNLIVLNKNIMIKYINSLLIMILPICPHWSTYLLDYCSTYFNMDRVWNEYPCINNKLLFINDILDTVIHNANATFNRISKVYKKKKKNINDIKININCYNKLSPLELLLINIIISNKTDIYISDLLKSDNNKDYKNKCIQFIKNTENKIKKYGTEYIKWITNCVYYDILLEWFTKLVNFKSNFINIILHPDNTDVELVYGSYNPQIIFK
jgi:leucyl-tRNA synthetase